MSTLIHNAASGPALQTVNIGSLVRSDGLLFGKYFERYDEMDFLNFLESNMAWEVGTEATATWHENGHILNNITIASFTGGAAPNAPAVITIAAADHTQAGTRSPFHENYVVKVDNTYMYVQSKNTSVASAHTITVVPVNSSVQLNSVLAANKVVIPIAPHFAERTGYAESESNTLVQYEEKFGIVKSRKSVSGSEATNKMKITTPDGKDAIIFKEDKDVFNLHKLQLSHALLFGPGGTVVDGSGNTVQLIKGMEQQIRDRGNVYSYYGNETISDLYNYTRILKREQAPKQVFSFEGHEICINREQLITETMKSGGIVYATLDKTLNGAPQGAKKLIDFGFSGFELAGYTIARREFNEFNNPITTAAPGQTYPYRSFMVPVDLIRDAKDKKNKFNMRICYKALKNGPKGISLERKFQFRQGGDSSLTPDSQTDEINFRYLTEAAMVLVLANQAIITERADV